MGWARDRRRSGRGSRILGGLVLALGLGLPVAAGAAGGDVQVGAVTPGGDLNINGDAGNNDFTVTQNANGTVTITGNNGTTINGKGSHTTAGPVTGEIDIRGRGGDDKITVDGINNLDDLDVRDQIGDNDIDIKNVKVKDKLKVVNNDGSIDIEDSSWGRRDIRPGQGTVNPANLNGRGGAGSVGTPPSGGGGGDGQKSVYDKTAGPRNAIKKGLPTDNPGQRGMLPEPHVPQGPTRTYPKPKGRY